MNVTAAEFPTGDKDDSGLEVSKLHQVQMKQTVNDNVSELKEIIQLCMGMLTQAQLVKVFAVLGKDKSEKYFRFLSVTGRSMQSEIDWQRLEKLAQLQ